jgi:hypothetical protein
MRFAKVVVFIFGCSSVFCAAQPPPRATVVWHFERGITNDLGGMYNAFKRDPSWARTYLDPRVSRTPGGYSLRVTAHREDEGFCGVWLDFNPASAVPRQYLDATPYRYLSFWAQGQKGGEDFEIEIVDEATIEDEDTRTRRPLRAYLPQGLSTNWQHVLIPLADFNLIDPKHLVRVTFNIHRRGNFRFYIDDIGFQYDPATSPPQRDVPSPAGRIAGRGSYRAMWVWNTEPLFDPSKPEEANRFFAFCASQQIRQVYLATEFNGLGASGSPRLEVRNPARYRAFLARAHQRGLVIDGLAGTPEWAVRENHGHALAASDAIAAFNRASPAGARFDGIHFDVEPYLLIGYSDPSYRSEILTGLLEMTEKCAGRARTAGLSFSGDVPSWFFPADGLERDRLTVEFKGREKTVGEHLTDMLDSVTIMDYTNQADGAGGIIARGLPALEYAARQNKKIVVGLETFTEGDSTVAFVCGLPIEDFRARLASTGLRNQFYHEGHRLSVCSDDVNMHIGLHMPRDMTPEKHAAFEGALARLARKLGVRTDPGRHSTSEMLEIARAALTGNPEWKGFEPFEFTDPESGSPIPGFRAVYRMLPSITFHGLGREVFQEEFDSTVEWLGRHPSFGGMAIHFYESFRDLVEGEKAESGIRSQQPEGKSK